MDFDLPKEEISEEEIDALGIKKKDSADIDIDLPEDDTIVPAELDEEDKEEEEDKGIFGDDKAFEDQLLDPYGDRDNY